MGLCFPAPSVDQVKGSMVCRNPTQELSARCFNIDRRPPRPLQTTLTPGDRHLITFLKHPEVVDPISSRHTCTTDIEGTHLHLVKRDLNLSNNHRRLRPRPNPRTSQRCY